MIRNFPQLDRTPFTAAELVDLAAPESLDELVVWADRTATRVAKRFGFETVEAFDDIPYVWRLHCQRLFAAFVVEQIRDAFDEQQRLSKATTAFSNDHLAEMFREVLSAIQGGTEEG